MNFSKWLEQDVLQDYRPETFLLANQQHQNTKNKNGEWCELPVMISWIDGNSTRLVHPSTDESMLPAVAAIISRYVKHFNAIITSIGPVQIIVNPVKRKAGNNTAANRQYSRCAIDGTQVFPANYTLNPTAKFE